MLREILLSLSGYPSSIWDKIDNGSDIQHDGLQAYCSPAEQAMLKVLAHQSQLHIEINKATARITTEQTSMICRAVAASISAHHLGAYRNKVLQVETSILQKDAAYVGGYQIVPLSTIVAEFSPWTRRMEWLHTVVTRIGGQTRGIDARPICRGPDLLQFLHKETFTGYSDIEEIAVDLLIQGQRVWMRTVASWILYGKLPAAGLQDLFVQLSAESLPKSTQASIDRTLVPYFASDDAAESICSIGNALLQVKSQRSSGLHQSHRWVDPAMALLRGHLQQLESLSYPLNLSQLESVVSSIDQSISRNVLSHLLPTEAVFNFLNVVQQYLLLGRGEFAISLITHADEHIETRRQSHGMMEPARKIGRLDNLVVKDADLNGILSKTWSEMTALQMINDYQDDELSRARKIFRLMVTVESDSQDEISTLLPTPVSLIPSLPPDSPLNLFMSQSDAKLYGVINAYLVSLRRAEFRLSRLWSLTSHRRCHPTPLGPPRSATRAGQQTLAARRTRESQRTTLLRQHWATASKALFVLSEFGAYLHGEVISSSFTHFLTWAGLEGSPKPSLFRLQASRPTMASSSQQDMKSSISSFANDGSQLSNDHAIARPHDPRALATAHRAYLRALYRTLLLEAQDFLKVLRAFLSLIDHYVALFVRLQTVWQGLDLQEDDGVLDAFSDYAADEKEILAEMGRSRIVLEDTLDELVKSIKAVEQDHRTEAVTASMAQVDLDRQKFVPWRARTIDRLIMKLDFLAGRHDTHDDTGFGAYEDD